MESSHPQKYYYDYYYLALKPVNSTAASSLFMYINQQQQQQQQQQQKQWPLTLQVYIHLPNFRPWAIFRVPEASETVVVGVVG